ncbi:L-iditol 2-dehydrogenase [Verrucomicrobium sp. GAS474]|uniref:alcohol dehydrogenase catalytic domain-containing protein n=1 Tax=Verrucomicrobium sp. GAS474 TaxID=1882831 RepID=UPI00087AC8AB|nr:alcohol dehydrogenase catalytic domain-containing protein [Verrucomicrobium sp. GAS474]SDT98712.1 L-iditol 2-dehydrogenase [Verrucomicrobium sp. GAS474]
MNAALLYEKEDLRLGTLPEPQIGEGEVLIRTGGASICGTDIRMWKNGHAFATPDQPLVIGHEMAGTIARVGAGVRGLQAGQRVCVAPNYNPVSSELTVAGEGYLDPDYRALGIHEHGAFAEYVRIPREAVLQGNLFPIPNHVSFAAAAMVEPLSCVYNNYEKARTGPGDVVLIVGAGPIGVMHAKLSKMVGAGKVIVNDRHEDRLALVRSIDPSFITICGDPGEELKRLTGGRGADVIITACSSADIQARAVELAAVNGRVLFFGGLPKGKSHVPLDTNLIHYKQLLVTGTTRQSLRQFQKTLALIADGLLVVDDLVTATYPLGEIQKAFAGAVSRTGGLKTAISFN